jgi:hypothetical protein
MDLVTQLKELIMVELIRLLGLGLRFRKAWELSGMSKIALRSIQLFGWALIFTGVYLFMSDKVQAVHEEADNRVAAKLTQQAGEINELRKIAATCLSDHIGKPIQIGDEWFLCSIQSIGVYKK